MKDWTERVEELNPDEQKYKCSNCDNKYYNDHFDLDEDGEICNECFKEKEV
jgi:formylmethanofuran dehydrogenase subunit E